MKKQLLFLILILWSFRSGAQVTPYHYTIPADVSNQLVFCMEQDVFGRLLIGTDKGLYRYNGFRSKRLKTVGAFSKEITQLLRVSDYFLATNRAGQVLEVRHDQVKALKLKELKGDIRQISIEGGYLEVVTTKEVFSYKLPNYQFVEKEQIPFTEPKGILANGFITYKNARFSVLNSGELVEVDDEEARYIPKGTGKQLLPFANQLVVIPSYSANENVYTYHSGQFKSFGPLIARRNVRVIKAEVIGNQLFVLSDYGVFVYTGGLYRKPALWFEGLAATDIFKDSQRNLWISTKGKGLVFIPAGKHEIVNPTSFLSIENGPNTTFFGGLVNGNISQFDGHGREMRIFSHPYSNQEVQFIHYDSKQQLVFSNNTIFTMLGELPPLALNESLKGVVRTQKGNLLIAKSTGLVMYKSKPVRQLLKSFSDSAAFTTLIAVPARQLVQNTSDKRIAFSTQQGLYFLDENEQLVEQLHFSKSIDAQQMVWFKNDLYVATTDNKLLVIRNGKVVKERFLSDSGAELLVVKMLATEDYIYFLTEKGMYRLEDIDKKFESLKDVIGFDGLAMRDFVVNKNVLHIATQKGVLRYAWNQDNHMSLALVMGKAYGRTKMLSTQADSVVVFSSEERFIVIPFECVDLSGTHQFILQYRIHTKDEWGVWNNLPVTTEQINFSHLTADNYTVEMRMLDPVSKMSTPVQRRYFNLEASWYEHYYLWFFFGAAFSMGGFWTYKKWRSRRESQMA